MGGSMSVDKDELVEIVHDLKAPLATIALEVTLLDHRIADGEAVDARPVLARLLHNVDFLDRMVHDLLDDWSPVTRRRALADMRTLLQKTLDRSLFTKDRSRVRLDSPVTASVRV